MSIMTLLCTCLNKNAQLIGRVSSQVYDVSSFVSRHPGGVDQIMFGAGRDITQLFESYHSLEVYKYVGTISSLHAVVYW